MNGISFMVRIRNEENTLYKSIKSLFNLKINHEIILILHLCNDKSKEIAELLAKENSKIKIYEYDIEISKPGYETLATDKNSKHSIPTYYNWCLSKLSYPWTFKWDADMIASEGLINFLNNNEWYKQNKNYKIKACNSTSENAESYLMGNLNEYKKYWFWEIPSMYDNPIIETVDNSINIIHDSELTNIKKYWKKTPWFEDNDIEEAKIVKQRLLLLENDFGKEPIGLFRASNPECNSFIQKIMNSQCKYINPYE
jgi:hypothetical protein